MMDGRLLTTWFAKHGMFKHRTSTGTQTKEHTTTADGAAGAWCYTTDPGIRWYLSLWVEAHWIFVEVSNDLMYVKARICG